MVMEIEITACFSLGTIGYAIVAFGILTRLPFGVE